VTTLIALSVSLLTSFACDEAVPLAQGVQSPCEGILVPAPDALEAVHCARVALPHCRVAFDSLNEEMVIKLDAAAQEQDILLDRVSKQDALITQLSVGKANRRLGWLDSPVIWGGAGAAVGVAVTLAILKATALAQ